MKTNLGLGMTDVPIKILRKIAETENIPVSDYSYLESPWVLNLKEHTWLKPAKIAIAVYKYYLSTDSNTRRFRIDGSNVLLEGSNGTKIVIGVNNGAYYYFKIYFDSVEFKEMTYPRDMTRAIKAYSQKGETFTVSMFGKPDRLEYTDAEKKRDDRKKLRDTPIVNQERVRAVEKLTKAKLTKYFKNFINEIYYDQDEIVNQMIESNWDLTRIFQDRIEKFGEKELSGYYIRDRLNSKLK